MPWLICPTCKRWTEREAWVAAPRQGFPFAIVCPIWRAPCDVADADLLLRRQPDDPHAGADAG